MKEVRYHLLDIPDSVTYLNQIPLFECCVVRCGSKNRYQEGITSLNEIGLHAQNMITVHVMGDYRREHLCSLPH